MTSNSVLAKCATLVVMLLASGCGGGGSASAPTNFSLGGTMAGLNSGVKITLQDKGGASVEILSNGPFSFANMRPPGSNYEVSISSQPTGQRCQLSQGSGTIASASVTSIAVTCQTAYAYVLNNQLKPGATDQYTVSQYTFGANGQMRAGDAPDTPIDPNRVYMTVDTKAANVFFSLPDKNAIAAYGIGAKGELSARPAASVRSGDTPVGTTLSPNGKFLYSYNYWDGSIYRYQLGTDGGFSSLATGTQVARVSSVSSLAIDASGKRAYAGDSYSDRIYQFSIGDDGSLTPAAAAGIVTDSAPIDLLLDPSGKFAYSLNNGDGSISQYTIGADGMLAPMAPANVKLTSRGVFMAITPNGKYAYANGNNNIAQFAIGANGQLTPLSPAGVPTTDDAMTMAFDATGSYAYVANYIEKTVVQYAVGANGQLTELGRVATRGQPAQIALFYR